MVKLFDNINFNKNWVYKLTNIQSIYNSNSTERRKSRITSTEQRFEILIKRSIN
jgi:hypothetical protein